MVSTENSQVTSRFVGTDLFRCILYHNSLEFARVSLESVSHQWAAPDLRGGQGARAPHQGGPPTIFMCLSICVICACHSVIFSKESLFVDASDYIGRPDSSISLDVIWYCDETTIALTGFLKVDLRYMSIRRKFSRGGQRQHLLILVRLLTMQRKWPFTKRFTLSTRLHHKESAPCYDNSHKKCASLAAIASGATRGGRGRQCPGAALLVKRRNSKWSFTNEPELRFRFYILVKVVPTIRLAGTVPV